MKEIQSNINIIGGGLIGAVTAYALSKLGNKVVVLEQNAKFNHKNILDKRTTAISEGTKKFLEEINIWNEIGNYAEPIKNIQIIDRNQSNKIYFDNQRRKSNLGYEVMGTIPSYAIPNDIPIWTSSNTGSSIFLSFDIVLVVLYMALPL